MMVLACGTALDAKRRTHRRLPDASKDLLSQMSTQGLLSTSKVTKAATDTYSLPPS